ncbi:MAG TPA: hypothetical protein V6D20_20380 [Candidatus Obscuribacterales bacterium]
MDIFEPSDRPSVVGQVTMAAIAPAIQLLKTAILLPTVFIYSSPPCSRNC